MKILRLLIVSTLMIISACSNSSNPFQLNVKVVDTKGNAIANATVVLGNQAGTMLTFEQTNAEGKASFLFPPPNATVTAAYSCAPLTRTYYYIDAVYDVNVSAVALTLEAVCNQVVDKEVTFNVTNQITGGTNNMVTVGGLTYGGSSNSFTIDINNGIQSDGNFSAIATTEDDENNIMGYVFVLDQPAVAGSTVNMNIDRTDFVVNTHRFNNVPQDAAFHYVVTSLIRKRAETILPYNYAGGGGPLPASVNAYSYNGFADNHMVNATSVPVSEDVLDRADVGFISYLKTVSDQTFDFNLLPALPGGLTYDQGASGRPVISWLNNEPLATMQKVTFRDSDSTPGASFYYSMTVGPDATEVTFPELPDSLAAFRPVTYNRITLETTKFDIPASYNRYLNARAEYDGFFYDREDLSSYGYARIIHEPN